MRTRLTTLLLALGAIAVAPAAPAAAADEDGPYAVGKRSYTFVDSSRPTKPNGSYAGAPSRTLPTLLLYPARGNAFSPVAEDAVPARTSPRHRFPLIVFSHGFTASGPAYSILLERFAREGYVVAAPTYPLSSGGAPGGATITDYVNQPADVSYVIGRVLRLARQDRSLRSTISRRRIGVAGHSLGAITTLGVATNSCCVDRRIDAAVAWAGIQLPFGEGRFYATPTPPLLLVHGDADRTVPYSGSVNAYAAAPAPKALVTLLGAPHSPFGPPYVGPLVKTTTDFFDGYLKRDREALRALATDGDIPGVASVRQELGSSGR